MDEPPKMSFPEPLIYEPKKLPHLQTFIILHGRGSSADIFSTPLLKTAVGSSSLDSQNLEAANGRTLQDHFPHARFVFPTAARSRAKIYRRAFTKQWFDNWKLDPPTTARQELQVPGLRKTVEFIHNLIRIEADIVPGGVSNIVLGGLSQGCAASLISLMLWDGKPLARWFGMCGWLPFATTLIEEMRAVEPESTQSDAEDDIFEKDDDETAVADPVTEAMSWLRSELNVDGLNDEVSKTIPSKSTPLFLGHGLQDEIVSATLGKTAEKCLTGLGFNVSWKEYPNLHHWYSEDMLKDIREFLIKDTRMFDS